MGFIIERLVEMSFGVIAAALISGVTVLGRYLAGRIKNEKLRSYISLLSSIVKTNVLRTTQVVVEPAKRAAADGKLTKEEADAIKKAVVEAVKRQLPDDALRVFVKARIDYNELIDALVEREVLESKYGKEIKEIVK